MAKKGAILIYPVIFGFILALTIFYLLMIKGMPKIETSYIGEIQMATLKTMQEAEKDLTYIDNSAKLAGQQAIYELAENGGFKEERCGNYGFNLWNNKNEECFPDYRNNFTSLFNDKLNKFLVKYNLIDNYNFILKDKLQIIGFAINDLTLDIRVIKERISTIIEYIIPKDAEGIVKKIKENFGNKILEEIGKNPGVEESLIIAVIAQESQGDPNAISPTGCTGLVQFCYCTAWSYSILESPSCEKQGYKKTGIDIFNDLKPNQEKGNIKLPDDRLNSDKSIEAGIKYLSSLLDEFKDKTDKEKFAIAAYNGGSPIIKKAIKKTNKDNPSWPEVAQQITPDLIIDFKNYDEKRKKVSEIINYVNLVMGYKNKYEELNKANKITGQAIKSINDEPLGKYSVNPSFKINLSYDLDEYQNAIDDAKALIEKCKNLGSNELLDCINQNKKFTQDCETEKEKIISDFIELYESCSESNDFNCYCEMNINYKEGYEFPIASDEENYYIENRKFKSRDIDFIENYKVDKNEFSLKNNNKEIKGNKLVVYKEKRIIQPLPETIQLFFGKKEDNKLELFDKKIENPRLCNLKPERKFKFCYETTKQVLTEQGMKNPIIRFALTFPDTIAPEALNIEALNYQNDKNKIILTWNKNEGAAMYKIYYSENDFKDKKINELKANSELVNAEEIQEIELNKCEFNPEGEPCKFGKYNKKLESNKLYFVKNGENKDKYVYVLNLDKEYYFLITAVDDSGNEIDKIEDKNYKKIKPKNLLPLMQIKDLKVKQENSDVKLMWEKPEKYKDGSYFKNEEFKGYTIRLIEKKKPFNIQDVFVDKEEKVFTSMDKDDYNFYVGALNNDDIVSDYIAYP